MSKSWSISATAYLARTDLCPRCDHPVTLPDRCGFCHADLGGPLAAEVVAASIAAASALAVRQDLIETLPTLRPAAPAPRPVAQPIPAGATTGGGVREGSQVSVQSVLAVVGAALLAVAAIVFTFFNPQLTSFETRTAIVGVTTVVFLGGAWLLARARLQFSAEAVGALGMVFVVLDVWAFSHNAPSGTSAFVFAGIGTLFASVVMIAIAEVARIRSWLWLGFLGLAISPAWFGYAGGGTWSPIIGHLGVGAMALVVAEIAKRLRTRFRSQLRADAWLATVLQLLVAVVVIGRLAVLADRQNAAGSAATFGVLVVLAALSTRNSLARTWSLVAGSLVSLAALEITVAVGPTDGSWQIALAPAAAATALALLAAVTRNGTGTRLRLSRTSLLVGSIAVALVAAAAAFGVAAAKYALPFDGFFSSTEQLASSLGLASVAVGMLSVRYLVARQAPSALARAAGVVGLSFALASVIAFTGWDGLDRPVQLVASLVVALALVAPLAFSAKGRAWKLATRIPMLTAIHLLVLHAAVVAWSSPVLSEIGGLAVVLAIVGVTIAVPALLRPLHTAIGFGYALVVFAHPLQLAHLSTIAEFCITTALASAVALGVTLVRRIPARYWYSILVVTAVPFAIGIVTVLFVRSGWTALSTGVTFALALTLLLTNRPGLSRYLRTLAAALLVPALAVVVVCLGAQVLLVSASPITLPVIAVIVACVLPSTELIGAALRRRGLAAADARLARLGIEASTLLTGSLAVLLALVRAAAGLDTSFIVLLIVGLGAAAAALVTRRRYAWIAAAASWTGALWCFWGILGVQVLEPYLLPPAAAAATIGAVAVVRGLPGLGLYAVGLACAVAPSLVVLAGWGNGADVPWRTFGLLAGASTLVVLGGIVARRGAMSRVRSLVLPTLAVAIAAAAAGPLEAIRIGLRLDANRIAPFEPVTLAVLEVSVLAALLAAVAARLLITPSRLKRQRWRAAYVPALLFLTVGPVAGMRTGWLPVWTMFGLTLVVLALMIVTAVRGLRGRTALPPVWVFFLVAWCVAVAGWSDRYLRVEAFSLPLGLSLLAAGILAARRAPAVQWSLTSWPAGFGGSWRLLAPGIVATFLPSILATGTDPQTLRAILVIALALIAILIGSLRRLGAPFIIGIVVLPIENITVFAAQIGHTISATSWWITLASAGAVLLVIAVGYERRSGTERGVAARLRDLR